MSDINEVLKQRHASYGSFYENAVISQKLKVVLGLAAFNANTTEVKADQYEALDMICFKLSRIVTGDPNYIDNWVDIAGYAKLVADRLEKDQRHVVDTK